MKFLLTPGIVSTIPMLHPVKETFENVVVPVHQPNADERG